MKREEGEIEKVDTAFSLPNINFKVGIIRV